MRRVYLYADNPSRHDLVKGDLYRRGNLFWEWDGASFEPLGRWHRLWRQLVGDPYPLPQDEAPPSPSSRTE